MSKSLGIYFGPKVISLIEANGRKISNSIAIPRSVLSSGELEEKIPDEVKIVAIFKEELRKNKMDGKEVNIGLSGKDLIIRTFEIPVLPANELSAAITFEVKKYIPFKAEDLVFDFQVQFDKLSRRNQVLYVGIKKDALEKYLAIAAQLELKIGALEYSAFSILRFLKLANLNINKNIAGVLSADLHEEDEVNFTILENGFVLFSRDITLGGGGPQDMLQPSAPATPGMALEKLKSEIRISLDYYNRKFPSKKISNLFLTVNEENRLDLESFFKELSIPVQYVETRKVIGPRFPYSLSLIKGCGVALGKVIKTNLKIDILAAKEKAKAKKEEHIPAFEAASLFSGLRVDPKFVILGLLVCAAAFGLGMYRLMPLQKDLNAVIAMRPKVTSISADQGYDELKNIDKQFKNKVEIFNRLVNDQIALTEILDFLPKIMPNDMRLLDFNYNRRDNRAEFIFRGIIYMGDNDKEMAAINSFLVKMKEQNAIRNKFKEVNVTNIERRQIEKATATEFVINARM